MYDMFIYKKKKYFFFLHGRYIYYFLFDSTDGLFVLSLTIIKHFLKINYICVVYAHT